MLLQSNTLWGEKNGDKLVDVAKLYFLEYGGVTQEMVQITRELDALDIEEQCGLLSKHQWFTAGLQFIDHLETPFPHKVLHGLLPTQLGDVNFLPWLKLEKEYKQFSDSLGWKQEQSLYHKRIKKPQNESNAEDIG